MRLSLNRLTSIHAALVAGPISAFLFAAIASAQQPGAPVPQRPVAPPQPAAAPAPVAGTSVAVIDIAFIFKNHVRFNGQMNDMKTQIEGFDTTMRDETMQVQKLQEKMQTYNPSSAEFKKADEDLAHKKSDLQIRVQAKRREFLEQEARVYYNIYREVEEAVAQFSQRNRIQLVLRYTGDEMKAEDRASVLAGVNKPVVYQDRLDITQLILNQVNGGAVMPPGGGGAAPPAGGASIPPGTQNATRPVGPTVPQGPRPPATNLR